MTFRRIPQGLWFLLGCAAAALCIDFSSYHEMQHADSLLPVMVSLYKWEPFLWTQSRLGMLLPALALPFEHPFWNLMVQNGLGIFGALAAMGCVTWYLLRDQSWAAVAALSAIIFVVAFPSGDRFHLTNGSNPYPIPLGLSTLAIALVSERGGRRHLRWIVALFLTSIAYWYNFGIGTQMALLAGGRYLYIRLFTSDSTDDTRTWSKRGLQEFFLATLLTGFGTAFGFILMNSSPNQHASMSATHPSEWLQAWGTLSAALPHRLGHAITAVGVAVVFGILWLIRPTTRRAGFRAWGILALLVAWLWIQLLLSGTLYWVKINDYDVRYIYPGLFCIAPAAAILALGPPLIHFPRRARAIAALLSAALPCCAVAVYGLPSIGAAREALDRATGQNTKDLLGANCTHVVGNFWPVWTATFHVNMTLADNGQGRKLWPVTQRAEPMAILWIGGPADAALVGCVVPITETLPDVPPQYEWRWAFKELILQERRSQIAVFKAR